MNTLFIVSIVSSQFYFYKSGVPQVSHIIFLILSMFLYFTVQATNNFSNKRILNSQFIIILFFLHVGVINFTYYAFYYDVSFLLSTLHFLYGLLIFLGLPVFFKKTSFNFVYLSFLLSFVISFILAISNFGRFDFFPRYNAYFNDPNQYAFWLLCIFSSLILLRSHINIKLCKSNFFFVFLLLLLLFMLLKASSRSAFLGLLPLFLFFTFYHLSNFKYILLFIVFVFLCYFSLDFDFDFSDFNYFIDRVFSTDINNQLTARGYGRIFNNYEYFLYGSGHGAEWRFGSVYEIHSSWLGLFFYYGIIGISIFLFFIYNIVKNLTIKELFIISPPFIYGFSTFGIRTPIFWVFISLIYYISTKKYNYE